MGTRQSNQAAELAAADPFAGDLFAGEGRPVIRPALDLRARPEQELSPWHARLPRVTESQARASAMLAALPAVLTSEAAAVLAGVMARQAGLPDADVSLEPCDLREGELRAFPLDQGQGPRVFAHLTAEPTGAPLSAVMDADFAAALVDLLLRGEGARPQALRELSTAECAVIEFLTLTAVRELNGRVGNSLIRLERVSAEVPPWLTPGEARVLVVSTRITVGGATGFSRLYLSADALAALRAAGLRLARSPQERLSQKVALVRRVAPELRLSLVIGRTEVAAGDLSQLECGDVVMVAETCAVWFEERLTGSLRVRVGDGEQVVITGTALETTTKTVGLRVETVCGGHVPAVEGRMKMLEEAAEGTALAKTGQGADALDGLLLTIHVEIAARRLGVEELARLRPGQILDLGCQATDPVDLTIDGRRVARGELVEIEGRLGVRITQTW